jgi:hypothetical protein
MPVNQSPPNPYRIQPSSLDAFASPQIAAELARREQRLAGSAQAPAAPPAKVPPTSPPAQAAAAVRLAAAPQSAPPPVQATAPTATSAAALMTRASELKYWPINWVWPGRIARAKLTLPAGAPGSGKSTLAMSIIAAMTTGSSYPCDEGSAPSGSGSVILVAPGGDPDVLVPRLKAAGADLEHVHIITHVPDSVVPRPFALATDLPLLSSALPEPREAAARRG